VQIEEGKRDKGRGQEIRIRETPARHQSYFIVVARDIGFILCFYPLLPNS
jgi:hypothetical protein